jgi:TonB family protein
MRCAWLWLALAACGGTQVPPPPLPPPGVSRLAASPLLDPDVRGASYLSAVALALQPPWHQFLEDCRLRLPATHALNSPALAALAEIEIDRRGEIIAVRIATSGNADFDRAAKQVVLDASPLPPPPRALLSDDDHVHLAWTFARDRRQAGPATAQVIDVTLPLGAVVERWIGERDLARAARRILREKPGGERERATRRLMVAALHEGVTSSDIGVRQAAVVAIARGGIAELAGEARALATSTDVGLATTVVEHGFVPADELRARFHQEFADDPAFALVALKALAARDARAASDALRAEFAARPVTDPVVLQALAIVPIPDVGRDLVRAFARGDARLRRDVCSALARYPGAVAWPVLARGLADRDAGVRAACVDAVRGQGKAEPAQLARVRALVRDRDARVRARAIAALAAIDPASLPDASGDRAAEVRVAFAAALAGRPRAAAEPVLVSLADDRDPEVRAAAWTALAAAPSERTDLARLASRALADPATQVRLAALPLVRDEELLLRLANHDEAAEVKTAALVQLARMRTHSAIADHLLERFAEAVPASAERVRTALAWLLAR